MALGKAAIASASSTETTNCAVELTIAAMLQTPAIERSPGRSVLVRARDLETARTDAH
jgi:hypothetical protein